MYQNSSAAISYTQPLRGNAIRPHLIVSSTSIQTLYQAKASRRRLPLFLLSAVGSVIVLAIFLPLVKMKLESKGNHKIAAFEDAEFASVHTKSGSYLSRLSLNQRRELSAQVNFIAEQIKSTTFKNREPQKLALQIVLESRKAGYDPLFTASLILAESTFRPQARSAIGALGLMQVRPSTGHYIAKLNKLPWKGASSLYEPATNIKLGLTYLQYLQEKYNGDLHKSLLAYNWGPGNLSKALQGKPARIPSMSLQYSQKIRSIYADWKKDFELKLPRYVYMGHYEIAG